MTRYKILSLIVLSLSCLSARSQKFIIANNELLLPAVISFNDSSSIITPSVDSVLLFVKKYLDEKTSISLLRVEGYVNEKSKSAQLISEQRAIAVCKRLVEMGVDCTRLISVGYGANKSKAEPGKQSAQSISHVSFVNAALRGRAIGGLPLDGGGRLAGDPCR